MLDLNYNPRLLFKLHLLVYFFVGLDVNIPVSCTEVSHRHGLPSLRPYHAHVSTVGL